MPTALDRSRRPPERRPARAGPPDPRRGRGGPGSIGSRPPRARRRPATAPTGIRPGGPRRLRGLAARLAASAGDATRAAPKFDEQAALLRQAGRYRDMARALAHAGAAYAQADLPAAAGDRYSPRRTEPRRRPRRRPRSRPPARHRPGHRRGRTTPPGCRSSGPCNGSCRRRLSPSRRLERSASPCRIRPARSRLREACDGWNSSSQYGPPAIVIPMGLRPEGPGRSHGLPTSRISSERSSFGMTTAPFNSKQVGCASGHRTPVTVCKTHTLRERAPATRHGVGFNSRW